MAELVEIVLAERQYRSNDADDDDVTTLIIYSISLSVCPIFDMESICSLRRSGWQKNP